MYDQVSELQPRGVGEKDEKHMVYKKKFIGVGGWVGAAGKGNLNSALALIDTASNQTSLILQRACHSVHASPKITSTCYFCLSSVGPFLRLSVLKDYILQSLEGLNPKPRLCLCLVLYGTAD